MKKYIGLDLGGTNIKAGLVDLDTGKVITSKSIPTVAHEGSDAVLQRMSEITETLLVEKHLSKSDIGGIGVGLPGLLDLEKGTSLFLTNFPGHWMDVPVVEILTQKTGLPVSILNDARAITYGEWKFGAGQGADTIACFTIGTGVGGGLVVNRKLHLGSAGSAGELGHQVVDINGPLCGCGSKGCLETFVSGPAIAAMGVKAVMQGQTTIIGKMVNYDLNKITPFVVSQAAQQGDAVALEIFDQVGLYYSVAISNIYVTVCPEIVVLGGGVAAAGETLFAPIRKMLKMRVGNIPFDSVQVVPAMLGNNAGVMGLALWAHTRQTEV
jgi:glucokinase